MSQHIGRTSLAFARAWHHVDLSNDPRTLGRLASSVANTLMGKHKPVFNPMLDCGDYVVISNCKHLKVTGNKMEDKMYYSHSGKPGKLKAVPMETMAERKGMGELIRRAVYGMLPRNRLRKKRMERLKVFETHEHPYKQNLVAFADEAPQVEAKIEELAARKKARAQALAEYNARL